MSGRIVETAVRRRRRPQPPWTVLSQGISSAGSLALALAVLVAAGTTGFGHFSLAFSFYSLTLNATRAVAGSPMILKADEEMPERRRYASVVVGRAVLTGVMSALLLLVILLPLGVPVPVALLFAIGMPLLMVQDTFRYVFFADLEPRVSFLLDATWTGVQVVAFLVLAVLHVDGVAAYVAAWLGGALLSVLVASTRRRVPPEFAGVISKLHSERSVLGPLAVEMIALGALDFVCVTSIQVARGAEVVGQYREALLLLAPFNILLTGVILGVVPRAIVARSTTGVYTGRVLAPFLGIGALAAAAVLVVGLLPVVGHSERLAVIDRSWGWLICIVLVSAALAAVFAVLRVEKRLWAAMWVRLLAVPLAAVTVSVGAQAARAPGALGGYTTALAVELVVVLVVGASSLRRGWHAGRPA